MLEMGLAKVYRYTEFEVANFVLPSLGPVA